MPRFFFHLLSATARHPDEDGLEFESLEVAYLDAHRAAGEMALDIASSGGDPYEYRLVIEAEGGLCPAEIAFDELLPRRLPMAHALTCPQGRFLDVDDTFCAVVGREGSEIRSLDILAITAEVDRERNKADLEVLLQTGQPFRIRKRYWRGDCSSVWVENEVALFRNGAGSQTLIAACRLLTPIEAGWEAHDKASGLARPPSNEAVRSARVQAALRDRLTHQAIRRRRDGGR